MALDLSRSKKKYKCFSCEKFFLRYPIHVEKRGKYGVFCSLTCYWKSKKGKTTWLSKQMKPGIRFNTGRTHFKRENMLGEKHWNWKGGITSKERLERVRFQHTMQKDVFERDNYACQICEAKGDLQVDHIQKWSEYVKGRFDMNNCRTLCAKCHYQITFGKPMPESVQGWGHNLLGGVDP